MKSCIVYLAQNTAKDPLYGRDSRSMLEKSIDLLFLNYNNKFNHDVLVFHEGDFDKNSQEEIRKGRNEIQFHELSFAIPSFLNPQEIPEKWDGVYGIGQRHMARFYSYSIFQILDDLGYDWFMRMDDDSFLHSKINYNLFDYMVSKGYDYGYRAMLKEPLRPTFGFSEMVLAYLKAERIKPVSFLQNFNLSLELNNEYFSFKGRIKKWLTNAIDRLAEKLNHDLNNWPAATEWNRQTYYNNFLVTRIGFWKQPEVQSFLGFIDRVGGSYKYRWSDHIVQTVAVQIFMSEKRVHCFEDWTYEHATIKKGKLEWGGMFVGLGDQDLTVVKEFQEKHGKLIANQ
ncbi:MAG: hypothetical protein GJ680_11415 [Alteromonadaceae bacterium]|nr:hypothetical protein [Alteromonadaceae bacterium]